MSNDTEDTQRTVKATAKVEVTLIVHLTQPWPENATLEEIYRRARRQALDEVAIVINKSQGRGNQIRISGDCSVEAIAFEEPGR